MNYKFAQILAILLISPAVLAAPSVGINGDACVYETITDAIGAAAANDTIYVTSGTYPEQPGLIDKSLNFRVADDDCTSTGRAFVTIDGEEQSGGIFEISAAGPRPINVAFERFRFVNGRRKDGGIFQIGNASVVIDRGRLSTGEATDDGGCVYVAGGSLSLVDSELEGCTAIRDGGAIFVSNGSLTLTRTYAAYNSSGRSGGAISISSTKPNAKTLVIDGSTFDVNQTSENGGAIEFVGSDLSVDILRVSNSAFTNNVAGDSGGAIYATAFNQVQIGHSDFEQNSTTSNSLGAVGGGAISVISGSELRMTDIEVTGNESGRVGGGISAFNVERMVIEDAEVSGNEASQGGGVYAFSVEELDLNDTIVVDNLVEESFDGLGGGISVTGGAARCRRSTFLRNRAGAGAAVHAQFADTLFENCRFIDNNAFYIGGALALYGTQAEIRSGVTGPDACDARMLGANTYCSEFRGNAASEGGLGGAIYLARWDVNGDASQVTIDRTAIIENFADFSGSAVYVDSANIDAQEERNSLTLRNVLVHDNGANVLDFSNVYVGELADVVLENVTLAGNFGPALIAEGPDATVTLMNTVIWDNEGSSSASLLGTTVETQCAYSEPEATGSWNLGSTVDPQFVTDPDRGDYRLDSESSPVRDVCTTGPSDDLDGGSRPSNGLWDAGAFEVLAGPPDLLFADDFD